MKRAVLISTCAAAAIVVAGTASAATRPDAITGTYVEARNANVFVGACHYGSEYQSHGQDAILAWHIDRGSSGGADLTGQTVVAVVAGQGNLAEAGSRRSSVLYVDSTASGTQAAALAGIVRREAGKQLGSIVAIRRTIIRFRSAGDHIAVEVPGAVDLDASKLADRACCVMPYNVWYRPFAPVLHPIVGMAKANAYSGRDLNTTWSYPGQNSAFIGPFESHS